MDKPHKKLDVWKLSMELARTIYGLTAHYPGDERFGLVFRQLRGRTYRSSLQALLRPSQSSPLDRAEQRVAEYRSA